AHHRGHCPVGGAAAPEDRPARARVDRRRPLVGFPGWTRPRRPLSWWRVAHHRTEDVPMNPRWILPSALLALAGAAALADAADDDKAKIKGNWTMVSHVAGGEVSPEDKVKRLSLEVTDDRFVLKADGVARQEMTYKLDPGQKPKQINFVIPGGFLSSSK